MSQVLPKIGAVRIDETHYWSEDVQEKVDKVWGIYIFDKNTHTHCCEITPSYCLYNAGFAIEAPELDQDELEELEQDMYAGFCTEPVTYMHCHSVDKMPEENFDWDFHLNEDEYNFDDDDEYQQMMDDMIQYYCGNPTW